MNPELLLEETYERIFMLTLALEQAVTERNWSEVKGLLDTREREVAEVFRREVPNPAWATKIQEAEARVFRKLEQGKSEIRRKLQEGNSQTKKIHQYLSGSEPVRFDEAS